MDSKQIREKLKEVQEQLDNSRAILRAKQEELSPLHTQIGLLSKERDRLNWELISALIAKQQAGERTPPPMSTEQRNKIDELAAQFFEKSSDIQAVSAAIAEIIERRLAKEPICATS